MFLLDTNVVSEALRPSPSALVIRWLNQHSSACSISSISIFELSAGVAVLPDGGRRNALAAAVAGIRARFATRILPFDTAAADCAATLLEQARILGVGLHQIPQKLADLQIAGIANAAGKKLATRNVKDFRGLEVAVVNPWNQTP